MSSNLRLFLPRLLLTLGLASHAGFFLGLCQLEFAESSRARVAALVGQDENQWHRIKVTAREYGIGGLFAWYVDDIPEVKLYYGHARLALDHDARHLQEPAPTPLPPQPQVYRDVPLEYQPGALLQFVIPALISRYYPAYKYASAAWYLLLYLASLFGAMRLLLGRWPDAALAARAGGWSLLFLLCFGKLAAFRFDHAVPFFVVGALLVLARAMRDPGPGSLGWHLLFGFVAAAGTLTKITPGLVVPAAWIVLATRLPRRELTRIILAQGTGLLAGLGGLSLWFHLWFGSGYWASFTYHLQRGLQLESLGAGWAAALHLLGLAAETVHRYGAWEIITPLNSALLAFGPLLFVGLFALIVHRARRAPTNPASAPSMPEAALTITLLLLSAFILTNKVFSPQFLLWLAPLVIALLVTSTLPRTRLLLFLFIAALTQAIYPSFYFALRALNPWAVGLLNLRNALFVVFFFLLLRDQSRVAPASAFAAPDNGNGASGISGPP